jgi:hypothetical protein
MTLEDRDRAPSSAAAIPPSNRGTKAIGNTHSKVDSINAPDYQSTFNSSAASLENSMSELDFLLRSPVGHQWRNKKHWQTNANALQRRFQECSGKSYTTTPQGLTRKMRRRDIREALMASIETLAVPDLEDDGDEI